MMRYRQVFIAQVVIYASLRVWALTPEESSYSSKWVIHMREDSEWHLRERGVTSQSEQQHRLYNSITYQPVPRGWLHLGLKSRWTLADSLPKVIGEPATLNAAGQLEIFRNHLFATAGMHFPLSNFKGDPGDSLVFHRMINQWPALSENNILPLSSVEVGGYGRFRLMGIRVKLGASYWRPNSYELYPGIKNFYASVTRYSLHFYGKRQTVESAWVRFGEEADRSLKDAPAFKAGDIYHGRWRVFFPGKNQAMEVGLGGSWQQENESRTSRATPGLQKDDENFNIQRVFMQTTWIRSVGNGSLLSAEAVPQYLYQKWNSESGFEVKAKLGYGFHRLQQQSIKIICFFNYGSLEGETLMGGGGGISFTFRKKDDGAPWLERQQSENP